jgi:hypothetical protein
LKTTPPLSERRVQGARRKDIGSKLKTESLDPGIIGFPTLSLFYAR